MMLKYICICGQITLRTLYAHQLFCICGQITLRTLYAHQLFMYEWVLNSSVHAE
jgi:hypothetical protein